VGETGRLRDHRAQRHARRGTNLTGHAVDQFAVASRSRARTRRSARSARGPPGPARRSASSARRVRTPLFF
jgi:hypothetical protein